MQIYGGSVFKILHEYRMLTQMNVKNKCCFFCKSIFENKMNKYLYTWIRMLQCWRCTYKQDHCQKQKTNCMLGLELDFSQNIQFQKPQLEFIYLHSVKTYSNGCQPVLRFAWRFQILSFLTVQRAVWSLGSLSQALTAVSFMFVCNLFFRLLHNVFFVGGVFQYNNVVCNAGTLYYIWHTHRPLSTAYVDLY